MHSFKDFLACQSSVKLFLFQTALIQRKLNWGSCSAGQLLILQLKCSQMITSCSSEHSFPGFYCHSLMNLNKTIWLATQYYFETMNGNSDKEWKLKGLLFQYLLSSIKIFKMCCIFRKYQNSLILYEPTLCPLMYRKEQL